MKKYLYSLNEAIALIQQGKNLVITADDSLLSQLPAGKWIGGTTPYFMSENGGVLSKELLLIDDFSELGIGFTISQYNKQNIQSICREGFENGFTVFISPVDSTTLIEFSLHSLSYVDIFKNPIVGYVSGFDIDLPTTPKVYFGPTASALTDDGVALHIQLPAHKAARVEIINPNQIDKQSPIITFPIDSFSQKNCFVDGVEQNAAQYFTSIGKKNNSLPIVANFGGALINCDFRTIDLEKGEISFYSPIFAGEKYRMALPVDNYQKLFDETLQVDKTKVCYSCLCVSYYFLGNLENKIININGAFTFGEIGYQLLNQTVVYVIIDSI